VNLEIRRGEIFALLGPNGAGKTTLISVICGIVNPTAGTVLADGHDIVRDFRAARSTIGLVPQELSTDAFETVWATVTFSRGLFGKPKNPAYVEKVLRDLSLWDKRKEKIIALSGGMKRRVMIAKALAHEPRILFLDEPTAGVDVELRRDMWEMVRGLRENGVTIILTTHYLEEAESLCRRIAIIDHGRIVENTDMKSLLEKLQVETFILDLARPVDHAPELPGFDVHLRDAGTLEVAVPKTQSLNQLFVALAEQNFEVMSMRNKANRLEELFVRLVEQNLPEQNPQREKAS
jgi:ABC-2 type transport system ATP-binding protein